MSNIKVVSTTQRIVVDPATSSASVINGGPMGPGGPQGIQGNQGIQGPIGGFSYSVSDTLTAPPASGEIRFNSATAAGITTMWIHDNGWEVNAIGALWSNLPVGSRLVMHSIASGLWYDLVLTITSVSHSGAYTIFGVTYVAGVDLPGGFLTIINFGLMGPIGNTGPSGASTAIMSIPSMLLVAVGTPRFYFTATKTISNVAVSVGTAPTGTSLIVDVNKNGTTIFTTQGNRPTIAISGFSDLSSVPDITSVTSGDYLTVDVDQVGSTVAGADLVVEIFYS